MLMFSEGLLCSTVLVSILLISFNSPYNPIKSVLLLSHFIEEISETQVARGEVDTEKSLLLFSRSFPISGAIRHKGPVGNPNRKPSFIFLNPSSGSPRSQGSS